MSLTTSLLTLRDGRTLEIATCGDPTGQTVVFQHGTPGSIYMLAGHAAAMSDRPLFFVMTSRAGYGNSSRKQGRAVADVVSDIHEVLDQLGRDTYVTLGWSGGGPHALACAALGAPRCVGAIAVAGVAPATVDFDWTEGMSEANKAEFAAAREGGAAFEASIQEGYELLKDCTEENCVEMWRPWLSDVDAATLVHQADRQSFALGTSHAFINGPSGYFDDNVAMLKDWGFDATAIATPVGLWFGNDDLMVPASHGEWLASAIPGAAAHYHPIDGHLSIFTAHRDEIADEIESMFVR